MDVDEILDALSFEEGLPRAAMWAAGERRAEVAPALIGAIERRLDEGPDADVTDQLLLFAFHLLGGWRERTAFRPLLRLLSLPEDELEEILGDAITETAGRVVASVFDGDPGPIYALIADRGASEWARDAMFDVLVGAATRGELPRSEVARYLRDLVEELEGEAGNQVLVAWTAAVGALGLLDLVPRVKALYDDELIDPTIMDFEDFVADLKHAFENPEAPYGSFDRSHQPFGDAVEELSKWHGFSEAGLREERERRRRERLTSQGAAPAVNPFRDVGRNDPCPCGSGQKFKRCCLGTAG